MVFQKCWEMGKTITNQGKKSLFHQKMGFILCSNFFALLLTKISPLQTDQKASSSVIDVSPNLSYQQQHQPILLLSLHCLCILWFLRMINASIQSQTNKKNRSRFLNIPSSELWNKKIGLVNSGVKLVLEWKNNNNKIWCCFVNLLWHNYWE